MKLTLGQIHSSVNALKKLNDASLPIKVTYKLNKNIKEIENQLSVINDQINSLITKYGEEKDGQIIYGEVQVEDHQTGIYGSKLPVIAKLNFSSEKVIDYKIIVHSWDYSKTYTIEQKDINEKGEFSLPNYSAHYRIYAALEDENGDIVNAEYLLNIGDSTTLISE